MPWRVLIWGTRGHVARIGVERKSNVLEMDSISLHPSLVPWRGVEAERSWSVARRLGPNRAVWGVGVGDSGGTPSQKREYCFEQPWTAGMGERDRHRREE